jgi:hypothetical protein
VSKVVDMLDKPESRMRIENVKVESLECDKRDGSTHGVRV